MKKLVVIAGATACGKTSMSVRVAKHFNTEIVSCDSRQFYKEMSVGTAKPTINEMQGVIHHFVDSHSINEIITAGKFERLALPIIDELFLNHDFVILTGGSGLFIDAIVNGFDEMPITNPETRKELNDRLNSDGIIALYKELQIQDPEYAKIVDANNPNRIIRALEVCLNSKETYTDLRKGIKAKRNFEVVKIVLDRSREELYDRINKRVDLMLSEGLVSEVKLLLPFRSLNALQTVGYKELFDFFDDKISFERAIELIKQNSRRYAKRQLTWFRRDSGYHWIDANDFEKVIQLISTLS